MAELTPTLPSVMTGREFIRRFEQDSAFEILDGDEVPKMPNVFGHGQVANRLATALNLHATTDGLGEAL